MFGSDDFIETELDAWLACHVLLLGAWLAGELAGRVLRGLVPSVIARRWIGAIGIALVLAAPLVLGPRLPFMSLYDLGLVALIVALSFARLALPSRLVPAPPFAWALAAIVLLAGLGGVEWWARDRRVAHTWGLSPSLALFTPQGARDVRAMALYRDDGLYRTRVHAAPPGAGPRIIHLGDSMTEAADVPDGAGFCARLGARHPDEGHVDLGVSATGPDLHYLLLRKHAEALRPSLVVHHVFPGNDVADIDRPLAFCGGGPLLDNGDPPAWRCPEPRWDTSLAQLARWGPPPYPLRLLARHFAIAEQLEYRFEAALAPGPPWTFDEVRGLSRLAAILAAEDAFVRARGARLLVVVLPVRETYVAEHPVARARVVEAVRRSGVRFLDAAQALADAPPGGRTWQPAPGNPHFDIDGHAAYAAWLDGRLRDALREAR